MGDKSRIKQHALGPNLEPGRTHCLLANPFCPVPYYLCMYGFCAIAAHEISMLSGVPGLVGDGIRDHDGTQAARPARFLLLLLCTLHWWWACLLVGSLHWPQPPHTHTHTPPSPFFCVAPPRHFLFLNFELPDVLHPRQGPTLQHLAFAPITALPAQIGSFCQSTYPAAAATLIDEAARLVGSATVNPHLGCKSSQAVLHSTCRQMSPRRPRQDLLARSCLVMASPRWDGSVPQGDETVAIVVDHDDDDDDGINK